MTKEDMVKIKLQTIRKAVVILCFMVVSAGVGYYFGQNDIKTSWKGFAPEINVTNKLPQNPPISDFSMFWDVWNQTTRMYVDKAKIDPQKMIYGAIYGMVAAIGDPYTVFLPPKENQESKDSLNGNFEGIGAQLGEREKRIVVVAPIPGSPASKVGLKSNDWIYKVNDIETRDWSVVQAVSKIRGPKGTSVKLTIVRSGESKPLDFEITRDTINVPAVTWEEKEASVSGKIKGKYAYISLTRFGEDTNGQWDKAILEIKDKLEDKEIRGIVLDVRNNPGGYLRGAVYVASEFLPISKLVVRQENYDGTGESYNVMRAGKLLELPLVILVNEGSASAAEILSGALQSYKRAKLVGVKTFGKGSVQQVADLKNGAGLHVTVSKWLLPNEVWIDKAGLTPDVKIELDEKLPNRDLQLEKAIETLINQ